eukprot:2571600-Pleurochrysis_carterae.AAC.4
MIKFACEANLNKLGYAPETQVRPRLTEPELSIAVAKMRFAMKLSFPEGAHARVFRGSSVVLAAFGFSRSPHELLCHAPACRSNSKLRPGYVIQACEHASSTRRARWYYFTGICNRLVHAAKLRAELCGRQSCVSGPEYCFVPTEVYDPIGSLCRER